MLYKIVSWEVSSPDSNNHAAQAMRETERDFDVQPEGVSDDWRAFIMGNALVVGAIQRVGESLLKKLAN